MNWIHRAVALLCLLLLWRIDSLGDDLDKEKLAHQATRIELHQTAEDGQGWKKLYETAQESATAYKTTADECISRENTARQYKTEREAVFEEDTPKERTPEDKAKVSNENTRKRAAVRINRPL